jgi:SagB-type dehydrogenase family enzyme
MANSDSKAREYREFLKPRWEDLDFDHTDQGLKVPVPPQEKPYDPKGVLVDLIPREDWKIAGFSVVDAIFGRRSRRKFLPDGLSLEELSFLLSSTQGIKRNQGKYSFRVVPSGGARHSFETYVYAGRVSGLQRGLYRYLPIENKLYREKPFDEGMTEELNEALGGQLWDAAAYFIWTTLPYRMEWRYSFASEKIIAIDVGHVCQNLYLACEAIGCGTCGIGAYSQEKMDRFLGVDGVEEFSLYMAPVGKALPSDGRSE